MDYTNRQSFSFNIWLSCVLLLMCTVYRTETAASFQGGRTFYKLAVSYTNAMSIVHK